MALYWSLKYTLSLLISSVEHKNAIFAEVCEEVRKKRAQFSGNNHFGKTQNILEGVLSPVLYLLYTAPLAEIIRSDGLDHHFYADDTQLYKSFKERDVHGKAARRKLCRWCMSLDKCKSRQDMGTVLVDYSQLFSWMNWRYSSIFQRFYTSIDD